MRKDCDVFILGAGLAGLTLALQIINKHSTTKIIIVDKKNLPAVSGTGSVGESTVEIASHYFSNILDLKDHLEQDQLPKLGLRYFLESKNPQIIEDRLEVGNNKFSLTPSYQLDRAKLEAHIWTILKAKGVECISNTKIVNFDPSPAEYNLEILINGEKRQSIRSNWFIDASGRGAFLRKKFDLKEKSEHECSAAWWKVKGEVRIDDWCSALEWTCRNNNENARWFSTNHLMGEGYWVWLIPLSSGQTSFGIVADSNLHPFSNYNTVSKAIEWLKTHEPKAAEICTNNEEFITDFGCLKNYSHGCKKVFSSEQWVMTGEAGVFIDPFYSPGSDFIAISNTYITDLISRSLNGEDVKSRANIYNDIYLGITKATHNTFRNQYPIMGNPLVLPIKIFWDWCFYWNFLARIFFDDKLCDLQFFSKMQDTIKLAKKLNDEMQKFLLDWNREERPITTKGFLDLSSYPYLYQLNAALSENFSENDCGYKIEERFTSGIKTLEVIAKEIKAISFLRKSEELSSQISENGYIARYYNDLNSYLHA